MRLGEILVLVGVALFSSSTGLLLGARAEQRRMMRQLTDEAQEWLDQHQAG
ncbi:MAG TPA: hypothetical protein VFO65_04455 [Acidimicrobiales bacterium]|nr:hypothetical protein [Acidimicrobiales bacterium]